ncbi:MAG: two-component system, cell cycle sensor histidine kinase and response regulator CckA [Solirubrobacteraceae bacterium]|nr:two-component system, cell cycle sensor histidine kinase and response regulator CckA [Solirubrobacteraceae bacterium]
MAGTAEMRLAALEAVLDAEREARRSEDGRALLLTEFSLTVNASVDDLDRTLQLTAERVAEQIGDVCAIWLLSDDGVTLENVAVQAHEPAQRDAVIRLTSSRRHVDREPIATSVVREGVTLFLPELAADASPQLVSPEHRELGDPLRVTSLVSCPLRARGAVTGTINIARTEPGAAAYTLADQAFLEELAARAGVAIDNARLYREARASSRALAMSEQRLRAMFDSSSVGIVARDPHGVLLECNRAYATMLGYTVEELIGMPVSAITAPGSDAGPTVPQLNADVGDVEVEYTYLRRDGSELHARVTASPVGDPDGRLLYWLALVEDVSERRRLEEQVRQTHKMEAIGQLAGGVAHDFNNLLTVIGGYGQVAQQRIGVGPGHEELVEILHAADRAAQLTRQLLAFSRRQRLNPELLDLDEVTTAVMPLLVRLIRADIEIVSLAHDDVPLVLADRSQLEQVIINLVVNARDAMPTGGALTLETQRVGTEACLIVTDTGSGMEAATVARIFEPFFTTKEVGQGTGLGLATVYGVVAQSGGRVEVSSEPDLGSTFKVYLPAAPAGSARAPARREHEREHARGTETVLLCEDEPTLRRLAEMILTEDGYTVLAAGRPSEALALASAHPGPIDVLVSDVIMPDMPGPELAERLRVVQPAASVVFMSGYTAETIGTHATLPHGSAFLQKPFDASSLPRAVRDILDAPTAAG